MRCLLWLWRTTNGKTLTNHLQMPLVHVCMSVCCNHYVEYYTVLNYTICLSAPGPESDEKPASPPSRSGSGTSHFATALDPLDPSHRNYVAKIQAELTPQKSPAVSCKMSDEKCIGKDALKRMLKRQLDSIICTVCFSPPTPLCPIYLTSTSTFPPSSFSPTIPVCLPLHLIFVL